VDLSQYNVQLMELTKAEKKEINGGSELSDAIWNAIRYVAGVTAKADPVLKYVYTKCITSV